MHYRRPGSWRVSLAAYDLLNTHAPAAEFWYVDRLQSEVNAYPDGRADIHEHPLEAFVMRIALSREL